MVGVLKGYDQLVNMVLDDTVEYLRGELFVWSAIPLQLLLLPWPRLGPHHMVPLFSPSACSLADASDPTTTTEETRTLGLVVCRGPNVTVLSPEDGMVEIENPFLAAGEEGGEE